MSSMNEIVSLCNDHGYTVGQMASAILVLQQPKIFQFVIQHSSMLGVSSREILCDILSKDMGNKTTGCVENKNHVAFIKEIGQDTPSMKCQFSQIFHALQGRYVFRNEALDDWAEMFKDDDIEKAIQHMSMLDLDQMEIVRTMQKKSEKLVFLQIILDEIFVSFVNGNLDAKTLTKAKAYQNGGDFASPFILDGFGPKGPPFSNSPLIDTGYDYPIDNEGYVVVGSTGHISLMRKLKIGKIATKELTLALTSIDNIEKFGDFYFGTLLQKPRFEFDDIEKQIEDLDDYEPIPEFFSTAYGLIKSQPGRAYYLHDTKRTTLIDYLVKTGYVVFNARRPQQIGSQLDRLTDKKEIKEMYRQKAIEEDKIVEKIKSTAQDVNWAEIVHQQEQEDQDVILERGVSYGCDIIVQKRSVADILSDFPQYALSHTNFVRACGTGSKKGTKRALALTSPVPTPFKEFYQRVVKILNMEFAAKGQAESWSYFVLSGIVSNVTIVFGDDEQPMVQRIN